jgi:response regulator RpfG family c-di-GMP phosphodiesterase
MTKIVLDVGNCDPDHSALKSMLTRVYDVSVLRAHELNDTLKLLEEHSIDLVLINRKLDIDYTDGMEILKLLKRNVSFRHIPVMIITNYPEHQQAATAEGAEYGFGKLQYSEPTTHERLSRILEKKRTNE